MIEQTSLCQMCHQRTAVGEFKAGRNRMIDGLDKTGVHKSAAKVADGLHVLHVPRLRREMDAD